MLQNSKMYFCRFGGMEEMVIIRLSEYKRLEANTTLEGVNEKNERIWALEQQVSGLLRAKSSHEQHLMSTNELLKRELNIIKSIWWYRLFVWLGL